MNKLMPNWIVVLITIVVLLVLTGLSVKIGFDKGAETERQIVVVQIADAYTRGYDRGYQEAWKVGYDKGKADGEAPYKLSNNTTFNLMWYGYYQSLIDFVKTEKPR